VNVAKEARSAATNATRCGRWKDVHFSALKLQLWKKSSDSKGPSDCGPLVGLGRRPVSEAHAVELELKLELKKIAFRFQI